MKPAAFAAVRCSHGLYAFIQVTEYLADDSRIIDTGYKLDAAAAHTACFSVDIEHPLQSQADGCHILFL